MYFKNGAKTNMVVLVSVMLSTMVLTGYALAADRGSNNSTNVTIATMTPVDTIAVNEDVADTIAVNEDVNVINITKNSNETTVTETIIKDEQKKSSPGFSLFDSLISLIPALILIMIYKIGRYKR